MDRHGRLRRPRDDKSGGGSIHTLPWFSVGKAALAAGPARVRDRCATVSFTADGARPSALAGELAARQVHCWSGNSYAIALTTALGLEPDGVLRLGLLHYNTADEVDAVLGHMGQLLG